MLRKLSVEQVAAFRRDGFLAPVAALSRDEAAHYRTALENYESALGTPLTAAPPMCARKLHVRFPWAADLVRHPSILDPIEDLIGPDILVFNATFFIKEARSDGITAWHQDSTYFGLEPQEHVTGWVALSDSSPESGCMDFLPGSVGWGQLRHASGALPNSINHGGQSVAGRFDESGAVAAPVRAGEMSCHHTRVLHRSGPNRTDDRRIGFGISYIPAHVRHTGSRRMPATLARGCDRYGHFDLEPDAGELSPDGAAAAHAAAYRGYRIGYEEQMARHAEAYRGAPNDLTSQGGT